MLADLNHNKVLALSRTLTFNFQDQTHFPGPGNFKNIRDFPGGMETLVTTHSKSPLHRCGTVCQYPQPPTGHHFTGVELSPSTPGPRLDTTSQLWNCLLVPPDPWLDTTSPVWNCLLVPSNPWLDTTSPVWNCLPVPSTPDWIPLHRCGTVCQYHQPSTGHHFTSVELSASTPDPRLGCTYSPTTTIFHQELKTFLYKSSFSDHKPVSSL